MLCASAVWTAREMVSTGRRRVLLPSMGGVMERTRAAGELHNHDKRTAWRSAGHSSPPANCAQGSGELRARPEGTASMTISCNCTPCELQRVDAGEGSSSGVLDCVWQARTPVAARIGASSTLVFNKMSATGPRQVHCKRADCTTMTRCNMQVAGASRLPWRTASRSWLNLMTAPAELHREN